MSDNYPAGVTEGHFQEDTSKPSYEYINRLGAREQQQVCLDYLEAKKLYADFEDWREENPSPKSWIERAVDFCEEQDSFWDWLNQ